MNTNLLVQKPRLSLILLGFAYILLGWYLSVHHIFWLVGTFVAIITFAVAWKSNPILRSLSWFLSQPLLIVVGVSLLVSLAITLMITQPVLLSIVSLPLITLLYALLEMKIANFRQNDIFLYSVVLAGVSLGIGEAIDFWILPSMRY